MKTRGGWREAPQAHEIAVKTAGQMTDEDVEARIRAFDQQIGTLIGRKPRENMVAHTPLLQSTLCAM